MTRPIAQSARTHPPSSTRNQMLRGILYGCIVLAMLLAPRITAAQPDTSSASGKLSANWEELTGPDFPHAIQQAQGVCLLPFGIMEKHGTQLPIGTDLIDVRYASFQAVKQAYAVVFPPYYFGQIAEARHEPGTISYPAHLQMELLQNTTDEMARNGCKKIVIVNGHGGNESLLPYFAQSQLDSPHDYVVYIYGLQHRAPNAAPIQDKVDEHAGETETSLMMVSRPDLLHMNRVGQESGADQNRVHLPPGVYTGIWWYAKFPDHYAGSAQYASAKLGEEDMKAWAEGIAGAIRAIKADQTSLQLQSEFYRKSTHPLDTRQ
ncbi:MAG TPA: creatininase family protein [Acidobacteriaceae bacterium]|nr:creatininase family protein [Acidobacteriaceae bacterium]